MSYNKSRIQIVGSYLEQVTRVLDTMGIFTENIINNCSPLAMTGTFDKTYQKYSDMPDLKPHELLNIRKNLKKVLSHDPNNFSDNFNVQPNGVEVRFQNTTEYLVYMNSCILLPVMEKADTVYSEYTTAEIVNAIKNSEGGCTRRTFPFSGSFNWKYYYDRFIDVILNEYDPEHIIFIRSNCSRFYMEEKDIKAYDSTLSDQFIGAMEQMDNYFIEKTHCLVVDDHFNNIPPRYVPCLFPYIQMGSKLSAAIADAIYDIIVNKNIDTHKSHFYGYTSDFSKVLLSRLSKDVIEQNAEQLKYIDDNMLTVDKLSKTQPAACEFFDNIIKLRRFLDVKTKYRLAEYAVDVQNKKFAADTELIELYTRYFKLDLNDIIAVYLLCNISENAAEYKKIVSDILNSSDCIPVNSARGFKEKNIAFLKEYPYISVKEFTEDNGDLYLPLENNCWLVLNANSDTPIKKFDFNACKEFDHNKVISDGYICSIEDADALTYSYDYYVEKARKGDGNKPTVLKFETERDFLDSLNYVDYPSLLENERFVFSICDNKPIMTQSYISVVDFSELFNPELVVVKICNGLGDQFCYLVLGQIISSLSGKPILYDDTVCTDFNGLEVNRFSKVKMNLLTNKLSIRLKTLDKRKIFLNLFYKISDDYIFMTNDYKRYSSCGIHCACFLSGNNLRKFVLNNLNQTYFNSLIRIENMKKIFQFELYDFIEFPPFIQQQHIELSKQMNSCDAVVVHIRKGDYVSLGWDVDNEYYDEAIEKVMSISDYKNKKFFVFSDDIRWCIANKEKLGLNKVGECEVVFVEGNKGDESFRDIQLMSCGKIMIAGESYFPVIAALYNRNLEVFICSNSQRKQLFASFFKNKYDVGEFSRNYNVNRHKQISKSH